MLVEDDPGVALGIEDDLTMEGYAVEVAADGVLALLDASRLAQSAETSGLDPGTDRGASRPRRGLGARRADRFSACSFAEIAHGITPVDTHETASGLHRIFEVVDHVFITVLVQGQGQLVPAQVCDRHDG